MSNKYLKKAAALCASSGYRKTLSKDERKKYDKEYRDAGTASWKNAGKNIATSTVTGIGTATGMTAGLAASKPLAQRIANHLKNRDIIRGERDLGKILNKGMKVHGAVRGAMIGAGAILGSMPGTLLADRFRHEHAKKMIEKNRNKNG